MSESEAIFLKEPPEKCRSTIFWSAFFKKKNLEETNSFEIRRKKVLPSMFLFDSVSYVLDAFSSSSFTDRIWALKSLRFGSWGIWNLSVWCYEETVLIGWNFKWTVVVCVENELLLYFVWRFFEIAGSCVPGIHAVHNFFCWFFVWSENDGKREGIRVFFFFVRLCAGVQWLVNSPLLPMIGQCLCTAKVGLSLKTWTKIPLQMGWTKLGLKKDQKGL